MDNSVQWSNPRPNVWESENGAYAIVKEGRGASAKYALAYRDNYLLAGGIFVKWEDGGRFPTLEAAQARADTLRVAGKGLPDSRSSREL